VAPRADNVRSFHLLTKPTPWYQKWWVWTIAGAVVLGAATTVAMITMRSPDVGSGEVVLTER
jgi:hypothetical protein